jgi:hypothetical protein
MIVCFTSIFINITAYHPNKGFLKVYEFYFCLQRGILDTCLCWQSVLFVEKTINLLQVTDKLYHIMLYRVHLAWAGFELTTLVVISTDCIGSCKSNYHTITTMTAPELFGRWTDYQIILAIYHYELLDDFPFNKWNRYEI